MNVGTGIMVGGRVPAEADGNVDPEAPASGPDPDPDPDPQLGSEAIEPSDWFDNADVDGVIPALPGRRVKPIGAIEDRLGRYPGIGDASETAGLAMIVSSQYPYGRSNLC
jgi:hypothetical protein